MLNFVASYRLVVACALSLAAPVSFGTAQDKEEPGKPKNQPEKSTKTPADSKENLKSLTKLRREQKKQDPITIEVEIPRELHATTRELPVLTVALKNVDEEKSLVRVLRPIPTGVALMWRWQIEVRDSDGNVISRPVQLAPREFPRGFKTVERLAFGEKWRTVLRMQDYIQIREPGDYAVRVFYNCEEESFYSREGVLESPIMCTSKEFKLKVEKPAPRVVEVPAGSRERAKALIAALSDDGPIRLISGEYVPSLYTFMDPKSPEGQLHKMGREAIPGLLDALRDEKLSFHRCGWVLGMLYEFNNERYLNPFSWGGTEDVTPAYEIKGSIQGFGGGGKPNLAKQRKFTQEWLKLAEDCWDFRETKK